MNRIIRIVGQNWLPGLLGLIIISGCSTTTPPTDTVAQAELAVRAARDARAADLAALDLKGAQEKLERARQAMSAKKYDDARRFAESAQVDAELAEAKSEAATLRGIADGVQRKIDTQQSDAEAESRKPLSRGSTNNNK
jgi:hypothetical protein